jgi:UDP-N-acetyl-D-mannosaminuronate dehydrogenase
VGYSPERLSPGNKNHGLKDIIKITSGSNNYALNQVDIYIKKLFQKEHSG